MAATETKEAQEQHAEPEPLAPKTVVLRVSIHCQGCKRKVDKILKGVHGVSKVDIDLRQHKVVVTGNVNSETLIWKLTKAGKHAELWPELKADSIKIKQPKEKQQSQPESSQGIHESDDEAVKVVASNNPEGSANRNTNTNAVKNSEGCGESNVNINKPNEGCANGKAGVQIQEPKPEVRQTVVISPAGPVTQKKVSIAVQVPNDNEATGNENKTGGAGGPSVAKKKKKKSTGKASTSTNNKGKEDASAGVTVEHHSDPKPNDGSGPSGNQSHGQTQGSESPPPHHQIYRQYPPHYYGTPPPPPLVQTVMSYHTAHPSSSYGGAAYYASPQPYSYTQVVCPENQMEPPPYTYERESYTSSQPSDSFELFSDENPNACSVM